MVLFGLMMTVAGGLLAVAPTFTVAVAALMLGAVSPTATEVGPFLSLEQSVLADVSQRGRRTRAFAAYNLLGSLGASAGSLASTPALLLAEASGSVDPMRPMFLLYAVLGIVAAGISAALPPEVEVEDRAARVPLSLQSRSRVSRIAALFATDSFAGGFVVQSTIAVWFEVAYPGTSGILGPVFSAANALSAFSFLLAARLGERYGLLETMVFTHIPSNVLLMLVPVAPTLPLAIAAFLGRQALSQMDVPTRQAYLSGIVSREERTAANAVTTAARNTTQAAGPFAAGAVIGLLRDFSAPFFIGGGLKIVYDLSIYATFRKIRPETV